MVCVLVNDGVVGVVWRMRYLRSVEDQQRVVGSVLGSRKVG
jgi:hypothetical protein